MCLRVYLDRQPRSEILQALSCSKYFSVCWTNRKYRDHSHLHFQFLHLPDPDPDHDLQILLHPHLRHLKIQVQRLLSPRISQSPWATNHLRDNSLVSSLDVSSLFFSLAGVPKMKKASRVYQPHYSNSYSHPLIYFWLGDWTKHSFADSSSLSKSDARRRTRQGFQHLCGFEECDDD